jgi:hypothetical protein
VEDIRPIKIKPTHMIQKEIEGRFIKMIINFSRKIQIIKEAISVQKLMKRPIRNIKKIITSTRVGIDIEKAGMIGRMHKLNKIITVT